MNLRERKKLGIPPSVFMGGGGGVGILERIQINGKEDGVNCYAPTSTVNIPTQCAPNDQPLSFNT